MKHTTIALVFAAAALLAGCAAASGTPDEAGSVSSRLAGTWVQTVQMENLPRASLHFKGNTLRFKNLHGVSGSVEYKVRGEDADGVTIGIYYTYEEKDRDGEKRNGILTRDFLLHVENGRPILSEKIVAHDGPGPIIFNEFLRKKDFVDGFESERKRMMNDRPAIPMMQE